MKLHIVSDHGGFDLQKAIVAKLKANYEIHEHSLSYDAHDDYPLQAAVLARQLQNKKNELGIAICTTGQGICIALNRFHFIRAALPRNEDEATLVRKHNAANAICLPGTLELHKAISLITAFIQAKPSTIARHQRRVSQLDNLTI